MASAPGYTYWIPFPSGPLREAIRTPLEFQLRARERFGDIVRFRLGPYVTHFLYHPDHVARILRDRQKNYLRGWQYNLLRRLFGENLVVSEGDYWRRQRRLAQPAFQHQRLAAYADVMVDATSELVHVWKESADAGASIEVAPAMSRLALEIAGRTLFSQDVSREANAIGSAFTSVSRFLDYRFRHPLTSPPTSLPTPMNRRFKRAKQELIDIVLSLVHRRRHEGVERGDLLSMLIQARDEETGEKMTDQELCIEALTFLIAGHETTAKGLTWTFYLLASNRTVRERLHEEIKSVVGDERPSSANVRRLVVTRMAVEESLRLYPPVWIVARQAVADDEIDGYRIPAKSTVALCPYVTHRHPEFWSQPDLFDPDRFSGERAANRHKGAYFPFLLGPHQCIGNEFAMLEMSLVVAMVLQQIDFSLLPEQKVRPTAALTLNPSGPIRILARCRR